MSTMAEARPKPRWFQTMENDNIMGKLVKTIWRLRERLRV